MTKKILILTGLLLALPVFVFADVSYERNPSGFTIENPVNFDVAFDIFSDTGCDLEEKNYWGLLFQSGDPDFEDIAISDNFFASTTLSNSFSINLPISDYGFVLTACSDFSDPTFEEWVLEGSGWGIVLEGNEEIPETIFEVISKEPVSIFQMPDDVLGSTTAHIGGLITGAGPFLWLLMGIPLAFVVIRKVIAVLPR